MDSALDMFVHQKHTEAVQMVKQQLLGKHAKKEPQKKELHATAAFILVCMACCYGNMTSHSFSPAVFDQFSLLCLPRLVPLS